MIVLLSPAKKFDFSNEYILQKSTNPIFLNEANELAYILKDFSSEKISSLMNISPQLGKLNYERYKDFSVKPQKDNLKQAAFAFAGDTYVGLEAKSINPKNFDFFQKHIRIISGLYGLLKPFDNIQAYRLEMGSKLKNKKGKDLYSYWNTKIAEKLNEEINSFGLEFFINLASEEYFKPVKKYLEKPIIIPKFFEKRNGELKMISFLAKKARGKMARFIVDNKILNIEDIKQFSEDGYIYNKELSNNQELFFIKENK